jgi:hypothetical protein
MAKAVFDIVSEDPQEKHIAEEMQPTTMHEHRGENRQRVGAGFGRKSGGDKRPFFDELIPAAEFHKEKQDV